MPSAQQWREAAAALREHAAAWDKRASEVEKVETDLFAAMLRWRVAHEEGGTLLDQTNAHHRLIAAVDAWRTAPSDTDHFGSCQHPPAG